MKNVIDKVILGIDPGTNLMGYGVIYIKNNEVFLESMGIIDMQKMGDHYVKLKHIFERTMQLIDGYNPDELAIEAQFHGKNVQSMLKLGRAQGAAIAAALTRDIPIFEYAPKKIKMSITGNGNAAKEQVAAMLQKILKFKEMPKHLDATDGLAVALCHHYQAQAINTKSSYKNWEDYLRKNPDKVITPRGKKEK
ncbi:MAG: crossover junction endodeoxyribonuclease RuvC [Bacteroidales bacterium]|nr:crossover junction endodeoxyribonuclease RuvC [Bacteroidales bacterium]